MVSTKLNLLHCGFRRALWALIGVLSFLVWDVASADTLVAGQLANNPSANTGEHIALILPTASPAYEDSATAVREGFMASYQADGRAGKIPPAFYYPTDGSPALILSTYQAAIHEGARLIIGPLTRDGVTALTNSSFISIPTLALNRPENGTSPQLYAFGMQSEDDIRQLARMLRNEGISNIAIVATRSSFFVRLADLLAEEWQGMNEVVAQNLSVSTEPDELKKLRSIFPLMGIGAIFLAADAHDACLIRPFLGTKIPIYTTSHANEGAGGDRRCLDLQGVRFLDMPYVLQAARDSTGEEVRPLAQHQRFYALGHDAFLLADKLLHGFPEDAQNLAGATGTISYFGNVFLHELVPAEFGKDGEAHLWTSSQPDSMASDKGGVARSNPAPAEGSK